MCLVWGGAREGPRDLHFYPWGNLGALSRGTSQQDAGAMRSQKVRRGATVPANARMAEDLLQGLAAGCRTYDQDSI